MNRSVVLAHYLGIVRKHWLLILIIAGVVLAAGTFYHSRQLPVFEAKAKLKIIRKAGNRTNSDVPLSFEEDQVFYNTQYNLLRTQLQWAEMVLDRAAWLMIRALDPAWKDHPGDAGEVVAGSLPDGLGAGLFDRLDDHADEDWSEIEGGSSDPDARKAVSSVRSTAFVGVYNLDADSFLGGVRANPVPGTYLAELSFQAKDRGVAVFFANLYAELYRDVSLVEREEIVRMEVARLTQDQKELDKKSRKAMEALKVFRNDSDNASILVGERKNVLQEEADVVASKINALQTEQIARRTAMNAAGENAETMLHDLNIHYNRTRQNQITTELAEILGGRVALEE